MPSSGGLPTRVTFEQASVTLQHWINNDELLYSSSARPGPPSNWTLKRVNIHSKDSQALPVADALSGALHVDGRNETLFFVQFGIQLATDNTNFYRGGMAGKLWRWDAKSNREAVRLLASHKGNIRDPMVYNDRVYFVSDASGRDNVWSSDFNGLDLRQETMFTDWSVREVSMSAASTPAKILFRVGADLYQLNLATPGDRPEKLTVEITSDHPEMRKRWIKQPAA